MTRAFSRLRFAALLMLLCFAPAALAFQAGEQQVSTESPGGLLAGTLLLPTERQTGAVVLILPGSGPTDRDGNGPGLKTDAYRRLAERLGACGVASLRIDKRGLGSSRAKDPAAEPRFGDTVEDAEAWLGFLDRQPGLLRRYLVGHSEGALTAILVARQEDLAGLVLLAAPGRPAAALLEQQLAHSGLEPALLESARQILGELQQGRRVAEVPAALHALFRPKVQGFLIDWLAIDPARALGETEEPVLVVQGTDDLQVGAEDARLLAEARPSVELVLVEGMNHVLKQAPAARAANLATYRDPSLPLAPPLVAAVQRFLGCRP